MAHEVLALKWRPHRFDEVIAQPHVVRALSNALSQQYLHHAYLFTGTRGVGKTTLARILAKCLNCETGIRQDPCDACTACQQIDAGRFVDLFEVDAASRTKVEDTRELLENVQYAPAQGRFKIYLIDEVHMLSGHSFNALLKTLEEPPPHVKFLLATTDPQKLPATVLSRCLQFHLLPMTTEQIATHIQSILTQENIAFNPAATHLIGKAAQGSMRDALSLLDQGIAYGNGRVTTDEIKSMLGAIEPTHLHALLEALAAEDGNRLLEGVQQLSALGVDFKHALSELLSLLHQIAVLQIAPDAQIEDQSGKLPDIAAHIAPETTQLYYDIASHGQRDLPYAPTPKIGFEMTLIRMLAFTFHDRTDLPRNTAPKQAPREATPVETADMGAKTWTNQVKQLGLTGAALILAQQCSLHKVEENTYYLHLNPKQKALYNPKYVERIQKALSEKTQKPICVTVEMITPNAETPAEHNKRLAQEQQAAAHDAIHNDESVQRIVQTFDATVVKASITPNTGD